MANVTLASMFWNRVERDGGRPAQQSKEAGVWKTRSWREVGEIVRELATGLLAQAERVVHELPPDKPPLGDTVLRKHVLGPVVEDAVADATRRRAANGRLDAVRVVRRRNPQVGSIRPAPVRIRQVVVATVQCPDLRGGLLSCCRSGDG